MGKRSGAHRRRPRFRFRARARARARVLRARRPAEAEERQTRGRVLEPSRAAVARPFHGDSRGQRDRLPAPFRDA